MTEEQQHPEDENEIIAQRRAKLAELRLRGNPFPNDFRRPIWPPSCMLRMKPKARRRWLLSRVRLALRDE